MTIDIAQSVLGSILLDKKAGTTISNKKFKEIDVWHDELKPYFDKLQEKGYIKGFWKNNVNFKILKPVSLQILEDL